MRPVRSPVADQAPGMGAGATVRGHGGFIRTRSGPPTPGAPRGDRIVEIGCGAGQATVPLAKRGLALTAVELGAALAARARVRTAGFKRAALESTLACATRSRPRSWLRSLGPARAGASGSKPFSAESEAGATDSDSQALDLFRFSDAPVFEALRLNRTEGGAGEAPPSRTPASGDIQDSSDPAASGYALPGAPRRERTSMIAAASRTPATTTSIHWLDTPSR